MNFKKIVYRFVVFGVLLLFLAYLKISTHPTTKGQCVILDHVSLDTVNFSNYNSLKLSASNTYKSDFFKNILQGHNYRQSWETPIEVPILFLDTLYNGVDIVKEGGGKQTKSLRLKTKDDLFLTLRSVNKDPKALIPPFLKTLNLQNIVIDGISGQHPYAALVIAKLSEAIDVLHTSPKLYFVPKQSTLGSLYNESYGNRLYYLEYELKGSYNWTDYNNVRTIVDTEDLLELNLSSDKNIKIDKKLLIRARLFDLIIGDWDRHAKQWGWVIIERESDWLAKPIPTDRDNAFFNIEGVIPSLIASKQITPHLQSFDKDIYFMDGLIYDFDVFFLQGTSTEQFLIEANYIKEQLTDDKIDKAFDVWNKELRELDAKALSTIIKYRRDHLVSIAKSFKQALDKKPLLNQPLKGTDVDDVKGSGINCFEC